LAHVAPPSAETNWSHVVLVPPPVERLTSIIPDPDPLNASEIR
jgi:hypothetical protein